MAYNPPMPLIVVLPILLPIIAVVVVVAGGGGGGGGGKKLKIALDKLFKKLGKKNNQPLARTEGAGNDETPYYNEQRYGDDYQHDYQHANDNRQNQADQNHHRRQAEKNKTIPSTSSALPSMSIGQVERLTQVVYAAMNSQECVQRLLCEVGSLSHSFSDATQTVTKAVEQYVPDKLKDSFNVFAKAEKCEQYKCGSLKMKN
jgi:hypothetical protein